MANESGAGTLLTFDAAEMRAFVTRLFTAKGWPEEDGRAVAEHLVLADQSGHPSHGIGMMPIYVNAMKLGHSKPSNRPKVLRRDGPFLVIDGQLCLGQVAANSAIADGIAIAREQGIAVVNLLDAAHVGRIGHYGEQVAAEGLAGVFWVNVHGRSPHVAPYGGRQMTLGTNPHCVAVPRAGGQPFLLDFATSDVAFGKVRVAHARGTKVRFGALVDASGRPTADPEVMFQEPKGALAPFGLHKGYGLAIAVEILSTLLGGGRTIAVHHDEGVTHNNMLAILLDPARMGGSASLETALEDLLGYVVSSPKAEGLDEILVPGDPEFRARAAAGDRLQIEPATWREVLAAAEWAAVTDVPRER